MKWDFVRKHFLNQRCCVKSTLSNTYTRNAAQHTHPLNSSPHPCAYLCVALVSFSFFFKVALALAPAPLQSRHISSWLLQRTALALGRKTFQQTLAALERGAEQLFAIKKLLTVFFPLNVVIVCRRWSSSVV